uniref:Uncharacterized protein n=1 Tax=Triticum urartu TaxID=4572 RepID=A0A8R7PRE1_TRIUA
MSRYSAASSPLTDGSTFVAHLPSLMASNTVLTFRTRSGTRPYARGASSYNRYPLS